VQSSICQEAMLVKGLRNLLLKEGCNSILDTRPRRVGLSSSGMRNRLFPPASKAASVPYKPKSKDNNDTSNICVDDNQCA